MHVISVNHHKQNYYYFEEGFSLTKSTNYSEWVAEIVRLVKGIFVWGVLANFKSSKSPYPNIGKKIPKKKWGWIIKIYFIRLNSKKWNFVTKIVFKIFHIVIIKLHKRIEKNLNY